MNNQSKQIQRKRRKTYNIEGHAHELTFSCYHQYNYLNDPQYCIFLMEELSSAREKYQFYIEAMSRGTLKPAIGGHFKSGHTGPG